MSASAADQGGHNNGRMDKTANGGRSRVQKWKPILHIIRSASSHFHYSCNGKRINFWSKMVSRKTATDLFQTVGCCIRRRS